MSFSKIIFLAGLLGISILQAVDTSAQGNLLITPRRAVFEGSAKSLDLNLANTGKDTATYAISLIQIRMKEDGGFETITEPDPDQKFADRNVRFFPRSVTLGPNEAQVVKVQLVRSNELKEGEYRSHFYFRSVPSVKPLGEVESIKDSSSISVRLTPVFGITIPVIIRVGDYSAGVTLSDLTLIDAKDADPVISMVFNRTGTMSVYGDLAVDHVSEQGIRTRVGNANGVAVYSPNLTRKFKFNLKKVQGVDLTGGKLVVTYSSSSDAKPARYAEAEVALHK